MKRLGPFFKYYGSKYRIAPKYPAPAYGTIVEPFAGSASYATLYADRQVILADTDPEVAALWRWLVSVSAADVRKLPVCLPVGLDLRTVDARPEAQLLMRYWQRVGMSKCWTVSKWGHMSGFWCAKTRDRVADQLSQIRHWRVLADDLTAWDLTHEATWFIDPPYQTQATVYKNAAPDFERLGAWCRTRRGQVIVCEAPGATWLPFQHLCDATVGPGGGGNGRHRAPELVWTGGLQ